MDKFSKWLIIMTILVLLALIFCQVCEYLGHPRIGAAIMLVSLIFYMPFAMLASSYSMMGISLKKKGGEPDG